MNKIVGAVAAFFSMFMFSGAAASVIVPRRRKTDLNINDKGFVVAADAEKPRYKTKIKEHSLYSAENNIPFGVRNNNAGNIRKTSDQWQGAVGVNNGFIVFDTPVDGLRALAKLLNNYYYIHDKRTVAEIITRWAPNNENNTNAYIKHVASVMSVPRSQVLNFPEQLQPLMQAIIKHENGIQPYSIAMIEDGIKRAVV